MANAGTMEVKVGADIKELLSKVDAAKAKLGQLVESQQGLKEKIKDVNTSLRLNEKELTAANVKLQQLNTSSKEGKTAAAALRTEIAQLAKNSASLNTQLSTAKASLATTTAEIKVQTAAVKQAENAHTGFAAGATKVYSGLRKLAYIIPGVGIAGLVSLISGPLIDAFSEWIETLDGVSDALKTAKANQENLNDILSSSNKEAAKQITDLKILYDAATNVNLSMKDRLAAVKGLQNEFPDYFKNIKTEAILNGEAKVSYDAAADSILRIARAKAAVTKLQEIGAKQLDNDIQRQKILNATANEAARAQDRVLKQQTTGSSLTGGGAGSSQVTITRAEQLKIIEARRDAALKIVDINAKSLKEQADFITKFIGLSDLAKGVETEIKTPKVKKDTESIKHIETISDVLKKLAIQIDFLNQKELLLKTDQSQAKINAIESTINTLMQKFGLQANNPIVLKLEAQVQDINLKDIFKKDAANRKTEKLEVPVDLEPKPEVKPYNSLNEETLRSLLFHELDRLHITKTVAVKIGVDMVGNDLIVGPEVITKDTPTIKLQKTLDDAKAKIGDFNKYLLSEEQKFSDSFNDILSSTINDSFAGLGEAIGKSIGSGGDLGQLIFGSFFETLSSGIEQLGKALIALGTAKIAVEKFTFAPGAATLLAGVATIALGAALKASLPQFAVGGYITGPGTKTSDSILARVSAGEYIVRGDIVQKYGVDFFDKLNKGLMPPKYDSFGFAKFAQGGFISPNVVNSSSVPSMSGISIGGSREIFIADSRLRGQDIVTSFKRASATISRNT